MMILLHNFLRGSAHAVRGRGSLLLVNVFQDVCLLESHTPGALVSPHRGPEITVFCTVTTELTFLAS